MSIQGFSLDQIKSYTYKDKQEKFFILKNISVFFKRLNYAVFHFKIITNKKLANCAITKLELEKTDKKDESFNKVKEVCEAILLRINQNDLLQKKFQDLIKPEENSSSESSGDLPLSNLKPEEPPQGQIPFVEKESSTPELLENKPEKHSSSSEPSDDNLSSPLTHEDGQGPTEMKESFSLKGNQLPNPVTSYNTNLNENESRPSWVPQKCISEKGILSTLNFSTCCLAPDGNNQEKYQWFFSQRKFPLLGQTDTFAFPKGIRHDVLFSKEFQNCPTRDGYAISPSAHGPDQAMFISDTDIMNIDECTTFRVMSQIPIGTYADGKTMIQQQGVRGCVAACAAMMAEDYGQKCSIDTLTSTNLADTGMLLLMLKNSKLQAANVEIQDISQMSNLIKDYGPISLAIDSNIGSHQIILDAITDEAATIRDPFHGWRITIPLKVLSDWLDLGIEAVYIKSSIPIS